MTITTHGGHRPGAGRPPRKAPKSLPVWVGQIDEETRQRILDALTPDERLSALLQAVEEKEQD